MCRWLAYSGSPVLLERALYAPAHSLIDQSLHSKLGAEATNGGCGRDSPSIGSGRTSTPASGCPPRRSQRAGLPHWAPALGAGGESLLGPRVQDPRLR